MTELDGQDRIEYEQDTEVNKAARNRKANSKQQVANALKKKVISTMNKNISFIKINIEDKSQHPG